MLKSTAGINRNPNSAALIAFKPRQVVLLEHRTNTMTKKKQTETPSLTPDQKVSLLHSVILYLENNGFSKTLKRFLSEAQIQNEDWKASSLDLEDLYCKYLDTCNRAETNFNTCKEEELQSAGTAKEDANNICAVSEDILKKKKKKKSGENDISVSAYQSEDTDKNLSDSVSAYQSEATDKNLSDSVKIPENVGYEEKSKGKKKSKKNSDSPDQNEQEHVETTESQQMIELTKKKDKKKKKNAPVSESSVKNVNPGKIESMEGVVEEQSKDSAPVESDSRKEKKSSKKRKRLISDESEHQPVGNEANEESKRRKTEDLEKSKKKDNLKIDDGGKENKHENEHENGNYEKNGDKCTSQKSMRKQLNGLAEPKTVNAFQRVKVDEVEFANEKLQDNSYWAKDGAEIGYGAKAQEVLGQVRGRDFRHEKTKKKRGSYRGGQIDQQSHSIKFNYSDED